MRAASRRRFHDNLTGYCFILPNLLGFLLFTSLPVAASLVLAFMNWDIITPAQFAGWRNFIDLARDAKFWKYLWNTIFLMSIIPVSMAVSLGMAVALNQNLRGRVVYRTLFFLPTITAGVAIYIVWSRLFSRDFGLLGKMLPAMPVWVVALIESLGMLVGLALILALLLRLTLDLLHSERAVPLKGLILGAAGVWLAQAINVVATLRLGVAPIVPGAAWLASLGETAGQGGWLNDPWLVKPALMLMGLWAAIGGYNMILYLAALQNIDPELYEAADIDGASRWHKFLHITWPLLTPTTFFIFVTSVIGGFQGGFESAFIMTAGGPPAAGLPGTPWAGVTVGETTTLSYYIFNNAYIYLKMGYAAAMAWVLFLLVFVATLLNWRYGGRKVEY